MLFIHLSRCRGYECSCWDASWQDHMSVLCIRVCLFPIFWDPLAKYLKNIIFSPSHSPYTTFNSDFLGTYDLSSPSFSTLFHVHPLMIFAIFSYLALMTLYTSFRSHEVVNSLTWKSIETWASQLSRCLFLCIMLLRCPVARQDNVEARHESLFISYFFEIHLYLNNILPKIFLENILQELWFCGLVEKQCVKNIL